ncbi:hypothetical protein [Paenibacillus qinlingensis]|nr:hypothetical protein [Paenibacillus qinlingensis]NQX58475.1 hypothetical protein [Paenibacillus qinlingensis]
MKDMIQKIVTYEPYFEELVSAMQELLHEGNLDLEAHARLQQLLLGVNQQ